MSKIKSVLAYEVIDSRGFPTVAAVITTAKGSIGKAIVPSGASTGEREAVELRDNDAKRFNGKGVLTAVKNVNKIIAPKLIDAFDVSDQQKIDDFMIKLDGTSNKSKLGANAILAVSLACAKAAAQDKKVPLYKYFADLAKLPEPSILPLPMLNVVNGGAHADNNIDFQEFMFMPVQAKSIHQAVQIASECFHALQKILHKAGHNTAKGDEGGFAPNLKSVDEVFEYMIKAIETAGYIADRKHVAIALDGACSELYNETTKTYSFLKAIANKTISKEEGTFTSDQMVAYWGNLVKKYPIVSIEDGFSEKDWDGFIKFSKEFGKNVQVVGDDLYCTNSAIVAEGIEKKATNSVLIKLNQIGTLSETIQTVKMVYDNGWTAVISHRSGETEDTTIADLSVGLGTGQIKTGSMSRSERIAKYNRLLEIENELDKNAKFLGAKSFKVVIK